MANIVPGKESHHSSLIQWKSSRIFAAIVDQHVCSKHHVKNWDLSECQIAFFIMEIHALGAVFMEVRKEVLTGHI